MQRLRASGAGAAWLLAIAAILLAGVAVRGATPPAFRRGDADQNGNVELTDAVFVLVFLFTGGAAPPCPDAADADDNGALQLTDGIVVLTYLFLDGLPLRPPFDECGVDPTPDSLECPRPVACGSQDEFTAFLERFDVLDTLAGAGRSDAGNEWQASFEGGPATEAELSRPHNALGDDAGNIFVADKEAHAIRRVSPDGIITTVAGTSLPGNGSDDPGPGTERALSNPNGLWVRGDGTVYILDLDNDKVRRLAPDGTMNTLFVVPGLIVGRGLWVADDESLAYVASGSELLRWTPAGGVEVLAADFAQLGNIAVDDDGTVVVTDRSAHLVQRVAADGSKTTIAGNGTPFGGGDGERALETGLNEVRGVWLVGGGAYLLATHRGSQVWFVDSQGIIHLLIDGDRSDSTHAGDGEPLDTPGRKMSEVRSVAMDPSGNIVLTENDLGYVRIVRAK